MICGTTPSSIPKPPTAEAGLTLRGDLCERHFSSTDLFHCIRFAWLGASGIRAAGLVRPQHPAARRTEQAPRVENFVGYNRQCTEKVRMERRDEGIRRERLGVQPAGRSHGGLCLALNIQTL